MELKSMSLIIGFNNLLLLIAPYGIEINNVCD